MASESSVARLFYAVNRSYHRDHCTSYYGDLRKFGECWRCYDKTRELNSAASVLIINKNGTQLQATLNNIKNRYEQRIQFTYENEEGGRREVFDLSDIDVFDTVDIAWALAQKGRPEI